MAKNPTLFYQLIDTGATRRDALRASGYRFPTARGYRQKAYELLRDRPKPPSPPAASAAGARPLPSAVSVLPDALQKVFRALPDRQQAGLLEPVYLPELRENLEWLRDRKAEQEAEQAAAAKPAPVGYLKLADGRLIHAGDYRILESECLKDAKKICAREGNPALLAGSDGYGTPSLEQVRETAKELILERASDWAISPVGKNCQQPGIIHRGPGPLVPGAPVFQSFAGEYTEETGLTARLPDSFNVETEGSDAAQVSATLESAIPSVKAARQNAYLAELERRERIGRDDPREVVAQAIRSRAQVESQLSRPSPTEDTGLEVIL